MPVAHPPFFPCPLLGFAQLVCFPNANVFMPSLGFLKKKRTRDGDPNSNSNNNSSNNNHNRTHSSSQPNSPVTPTGARSFDHSPTLPSPPSTEVHQKVAPAARPSEGEKVAMNSAAAHLTAPYAPPVHTTPSPGTDPHNLAPGVLPSIANLINPPQHDGASQQQPQQQQPPEQQQLQQQQQQQQASSIPAQQPSPDQPTQFPAPPANGGTAAGASLPGQQQQAATMPQQQPTPAQTPLVQQQARQTKGKYSLADFEILRTLGTGSFGRVHLVQSRHNQRFYAVKVLKKAQVVKMKQVEHTNDERKMLGEVKHPFLITLWGTFQDSRNLYMVMDFVEGGELFSLLRKSGVCSLPFPCCEPLLLVVVLLHGEELDDYETRGRGRED